MENKSNIILIIIGTFLSTQFCFARFYDIFFPLRFLFGRHHHYFLEGTLGFSSLIGVVLIGLGLYNIFKENNKPNINQPVNQNDKN